mgnify:CR=1 FL=1
MAGRVYSIYDHPAMSRLSGVRTRYTIGAGFAADDGTDWGTPAGQSSRRGAAPAPHYTPTGGGSPTVSPTNALVITNAPSDGPFPHLDPSPAPHTNPVNPPPGPGPGPGPGPSSSSTVYYVVGGVLLAVVGGVAFVVSRRKKGARSNPCRAMHRRGRR